MKKLIQDKNTILKICLMELQFQTTMLKLYLTLLLESIKTIRCCTRFWGRRGHEPAHAGFVAEGMLDAAVCGEIFTSLHLIKY